MEKMRRHRNFTCEVKERKVATLLKLGCSSNILVHDYTPNLKEQTYTLLIIYLFHKIFRKFDKFMIKTLDKNNL